jgi:hypothetical protein
MFQVTSGGSTKWFCIDAHDDSGPEGYFWPILEKVDHYFKLNCNPAVLVENPELARHSAKIHSLGCTFTLRPTKPYLFFPRFRPCKLYGWNWFSIKRRLRALQRNPSLQWHRNLREQQADKDVFLIRRYYQERGHSASNEECCRIFDSLKQNAGISGFLGFIGTSSETPDIFRQFAFGPDRSIRDHLTLMARSRVCIFMPGTYNCLSFKFGQYLALGKPIIGMKLPFWPLPDIDKHDHELLESQFCCTEPEQIPAKVKELLRDTERLDFLRTNNIRIFERYFSPAAVANRILQQVL